MKYDKRIAYRERLRERGLREVMIQLPDETVALIEEFYASQRFVNRSEAAKALIHRGLEEFLRNNRAA